MIKKLISTFLVATMIISSFAMIGFSAENTIKFNDVDANSEAGKAIYKLAEAGVVHGNGDGTFTPNNFVTRAELCKMVNNVWKFTTPAATGFSDVTTADWFYEEVLKAKQAGYIEGHDDGTFRGNDNVTREQVCAIIYRVGKMTTSLNAPVVADEISEWAVNYVMTIVDKGLIPLEEGNKFRATEDMKRYEVALVLSKFLPEENKKPVIIDQGTSGGNSSGGNIGGSTGGGSSSGGSSSGGSSGGGSSSGGSSGGGSSKKDYTEINADVVKNLKTARDELKDSSNYDSFTSGEKKIIDIVIDVIDSVIKEDDEYKITTSAIATRYDGDILRAMNLFSDISEEGRATFISKLSSLDKVTFDFLCTFFGVDADNYSDILDKISR